MTYTINNPEYQSLVPNGVSAEVAIGIIQEHIFKKCGRNSDGYDNDGFNVYGINDRGYLRDGSHVNDGDEDGWMKTIAVQK